MKEYKATYGISVILFWLNIVVMSAWLIIPLSIINHLYWWLGLMVTGITCIAAVFFILLVLLLNAILKSGTKNRVFLGDDKITYQGKTLSLQKVRRITLTFPFIGHSFYQKQELVLGIEDCAYMTVKRPSLSLIVAVKEICPQAKFSVKGWKSELIINTVIGGAAFIILTVMILCGKIS